MDLDFLTARLHARRSRLADGDRLDALCRIRSLAELSAALGLGRTFRSAADLQRHAVSALLDELTDICNELSDPRRELFDWLRRRFQLENLKILVRAFATGRQPAEVEPDLLPLPIELVLDHDGLAASRSAADFAALIPNEALRRGFEDMLTAYEKHPRPFYLECGLDRAYLVGLQSRLRVIPGGDRPYIAPIVRQEINTFHLQLAVRGRLAHRLDTEMLRSLYIPVSDVKRELFDQLLEAASPEAAARLLAGRAFDGSAPAEDPERSVGQRAADLEGLAWNRFYRLANSAFRRCHMSFGAVFAYASIRRVELANLIILVEAVRLGIPASETRLHLVPHRGEALAHV